MKKTRVVLLSVCVLLTVTCVFCVNMHNKQKKNIEELNICYELIKETIENGFDKEQVSKEEAIFKNVLENGFTETTFKKSMFYSNHLTFSTNNQWDYPENRIDLNIAHTRDLILAMYIGCVLYTEPENLTDELEWLKDGIWQIDPTPEFIHLIATVYNPDKKDIDVLVNAILEFSQTLEHPLDEYHTRSFIYTFVNEYNENNQDDVYILENEETFIKENIEISKKIAKEDFATIWVGYGKVIRME